MLSQAQLDRFQAGGYLVVEDLVDEATLDAVRREFGLM